MGGWFEMPKALEAKLKKEAKQKFARIKDRKVRKRREDAYVYGTMRKAGWKPKQERS